MAQSLESHGSVARTETKDFSDFIISEISALPKILIVEAIQLCPGMPMG